MRQQRKLVDGAVYHVTVRANRKEKLLASRLAKEILLEVLARAREKYGFRLDGFVLMENHIHLLIAPSIDSDLPKDMKWILGVYTMKFNHIFCSWGRVWSGRYFSRPIEGFIAHSQRGLTPPTQGESLS